MRLSFLFNNRVISGRKFSGILFRESLFEMLPFELFNSSGIVSPQPARINGIVCPDSYFLNIHKLSLGRLLHLKHKK